MQLSCRHCKKPLNVAPHELSVTCPFCGTENETPGTEATMPLAGSGIGLAPTVMPTPSGSRFGSGDDYVPFGGETVPAPPKAPKDPEATAATEWMGGQRAAEPGMEQTAPAPPRQSGVRRVSAPSNAPIPVPGQAPRAASEVEITMPVHPSAAPTQRPSNEFDVTAPARPSSSRNPLPQQTPSSFANSRPDEVDLVGQTIDGFHVTKKLGAGGMGAVCLARQLSLDREVALKILPGQFASNPDFLARFTREALSAAQLSHHNVIQVYDVGSQANVHYIAMEYVRGKSLGDMTRTEGRMTVEDAASYVLQTARGLQYAHERGIIHRDIKPDNIMVNEHGIVKIADMGLAKMNGVGEAQVGLDVAGTDQRMKQQAYSALTDANVAMGTPAYMAPEQGRDASKVDHRADQYSLGCTLYYLVAGKTPFTGKTTFELISKHATEPLVPIETIVKNVPKELSYIIEKMLAKDPESRYQSLKEVIGALEAYLGVESSKGPYTPREHHVDVLERSLKTYYGAGTLKLRLIVRLAFFGLFSLIFLGLAVAGQPFGASAALGLLVMTPLFHLLIDGMLEKSFLFRRVRSVFFGMNWKSWLAVLGGTAAVLVTLYFFNLLLPWVTVSVLALGLAVGYRFGLLRKLRAERAPAMADVNDMLKQLRIRGVSEENLQDFVYRFSGAHWEEFFEELFGYEDMLVIRGRFAKQDKVKPRKKFATWRDPLFRWLDEVEEGRRREREKKQLSKAEKARLKAGGMDDAAAGAQADKLAGDAVAGGLLLTAILPGMTGPSKADIERLDRELHQSTRRSRSGKLNWAFRSLRLVLGMVLIARVVADAGLVQVPALAGIAKLLAGWGYAAHPTVLIASAVAGLLLVLSFFTARIVTPLLLTVGAVLLAAGTMVAALAGRVTGSAHLTPQVALQAGALFILVGGIFVVKGLFFGKRR